MADEDNNEEAAGGGGDGGGDAAAECPKCEVCVPGLPGWMATFSDLVTLLLTFFVLLLSFAKTESAKYEAALGSIRNAFGGNVLKHGEVIQRGKSPDDSPTMLESQEPIKPFPIDFLTMEGILDKHEINRESDETLSMAKKDLSEYNLAENVEVHEMSEGIKMMIKDKIYFKKGDVTPLGSLPVEILKKLTDMVTQNKWTLYIVGHASRGEVSTKDPSVDAFMLSAQRAASVARSLSARGIPADRITTIFYGDSRPDKVTGTPTGEDPAKDRRVEFIIRKRDVTSTGHKVESR